MAKRQRTFTPDTLDDIYTRLDELTNIVRLLPKTPSAVERLNPVTFPDPVESQIAVDSRTNCLIYFANNKWREGCCAVHAIKVVHDRKFNRVEDGAFRFTIEEDLEDWDIVNAEAFNGTVGAGSTTIQIRNVTRGLDILTTPLVIPSGATVSNDAEVINTGGLITDPNNRCHLDDMIWINVTSVGANSKGLGVYITFRWK